MSPPTPQHILVPIDGSPGALRALSLAASLAAPLHAQLTILYVVDPKHFDAIATAATSVEGITRQALHALQEELPARVMAEALALLGQQPASSRVEHGNPVDVILDLGASHDLIVMGRSNVPGRNVFQLGSVSRQVLEATQQHVLIAG